MLAIVFVRSYGEWKPGEYLLVCVLRMVGQARAKAVIAEGSVALSRGSTDVAVGISAVG